MYKVDFFEDNQKKTIYSLDSEDKIRETLTAKGCVVLEIKKQRVYPWQRLNVAQIYASLLALSDLVGAGVKLSDAINSVINTVPSIQVKQQFSIIADAVKNGRDMSSAMNAQMFGITAIQMIKAGEKSGRLADALRVAAEHAKTLGNVKKEMFKKITYPLFILVVGVASLLVNIMFIVPKILDSELFKISVKDGDSFAMVVLKYISYGMPVFIFTGMVLSFVMYVYYKKDQEKAETQLIKLPYLKGFLFYRDFFISFFSLSKLLQSGEKLDTALNIVSDSAEFYTVKKDFKSAWNYLKDGKNFADGFRHISDVEKMILSSSVSMEKVAEACNTVAERFYRAYHDKLNGLAPKIYGIVLLFTFVIFLLLAFAIIIPYGKILGGFYG